MRVNNIQIYMLKLGTKINPMVWGRLLQRFGSSSAQTVQINKDATWLKYRGDRKLAWLEGMEDTHQPLPELGQVDPVAHLRGASFFSFNNLIYNDPYHHEPEHEPYADRPHGYSSGDDPNDVRFDVSAPLLISIGVIGGVLWLYVYMGQPAFGYTKEHMLAEAAIIERRIDEQLSKKAEYITQLQYEIQALRNKTDETDE